MLIWLPIYNDNDHLLTRTAVIVGESRSVACFGLHCRAWHLKAGKGICFKPFKEHFQSQASPSHFCGTRCLQSWPSVTQHHHLAADTFSAAEGHLCSWHWFWYISVKNVELCVWLLEQGIGFNGLKNHLRTRYTCIQTAFLMNWKLGKEDDQNYFTPSEISVLLKIASTESCS